MVAVPPAAGTLYRSPLYVKTIVDPSGEMAGYLSQVGSDWAIINIGESTNKVSANNFLIMKIETGN
jgi:hypothetical protein